MNNSINNIHTRLFWTSLIALVLAIGCFTLTQWVYAPSDDQCLWTVGAVRSGDSSSEPKVKTRVIIRALIPKGVAEAAGLMDGDELVAVHDLKVSEHLDNLTHQENRRRVLRDIMKMQAFMNSAPNGAIVQYTVIRDGQTITCPVELKKTFDIKNVLLLLTGIVAWAIGLLVVMSSPQRIVARHFYYLGLLTLILAAGSSTLGSYTVPVGVGLITSLCSLFSKALLAPMWFHFFLRFPYGFEIRKLRGFLVAVYAINVLTLLPEAIGLFNTDGSNWFLGLLLTSLPAKITAFASVGLYFQFILFGAGIVLFWIGSLKISDSRRKALMLPLLFSVAIFLDMLAYYWLSSSSNANVSDWGFFFHFNHFFFLPLPFLPVTFAVAILRHGFFDLRRAIVRWLSYFVSLGVLIVAYLAMLAWIFTVIVPENIPMSWLGAIMGLAAFPLAWTLKWLLGSLRRRFKRDINSARELILGNLRETKRRFSDEALMDGLVSSIHEAFRPQVLFCLSIKEGRVSLPPIPSHEDRHKARSESVDVQDFRLPQAMLRHAKENRELVYGLGHDESDWVLSQGKELRTYMDALGAQVMLLLMAGGQPHSALLLGGKFSELNYSRDDRELLREVGIAAGILLESAMMHRHLIDKTRLDQELQAARNIQESLITSKPPDIPGFQIALRLVPATETGGDLLWVRQRAPGKWIAVVGDVSGKGLAAAIYMSQSMALLNFAIRETEAPLEKLFAVMDHALRNLMSPKDFLTISVIEWDMGGRFKVVRGGHPPPIYLCGDLQSKPTQIMPTGLALGMRPASPLGWQIYESVLEPGEWIALYSDGITEAMDQNGALYGTERLAGQLARFRGTGSPRAACEAIFQQVAAFEVQNRDDRTLFILAREKHEK